jgi:hypothetical protein
MPIQVAILACKSTQTDVPHETISIASIASVRRILSCMHEVDTLFNPSVKE